MAQTQGDVKISFCLPVYNVKRYIAECIQSIYDQNIDNFEIVCVDDCSTDGSYEELMRIADIHPEMHIHRNESNSGVSYSRNHALKAAKGKYIWFVDPDDLLVNDAANKYYMIAEEHSAEVVLGRHWFFYDGKEIPNREHGSGAITKADFANPSTFYQPDPGTQGICFGIWLGIFKRDFLVDNTIKFHEDLHNWEDVEFYFEFGLKSSNVLLVDYYGYLYRIRKGSAIHNKEKYIRTYESAKHCAEIRRSYSSVIPSKYLKSYQAHLFFANLLMISSLCLHYDRKFISNELKWLKENKYYPCRYDESLDLVKNRDFLVKAYLKAIQVEPLFWAGHYFFILMKILKNV